MLGKLLKYDFIKLFKVLVIFYLLALFFAVSARLLLNIEGEMIWFILGQVAIGAMWGMAVSGIVNSITRTCIGFRNSMYGDESYITHTLPVKTSTLFVEKFILGTLATFFSLVIAILAVYIAYFPFHELGDLLSIITITTGSSKMAAGFFLFAIFFVEILAIYSVGMVGIVFGFKMNSKKNLWSVIYGFILYLLTQGFIVGCVALLGIFKPDVMKIFSGANINYITPEAIKLAAITMVVGYAASTIILQFIAERSVKKGVNVE